jgi:hypothetical protein
MLKLLVISQGREKERPGHALRTSRARGGLPGPAMQGTIGSPYSEDGISAKDGPKVLILSSIDYLPNFCAIFT